MVDKRRVAYFYSGDVGHYYYGPGHPMKPHRLKLAHHLLLSYGLYRKMDVYRPHPATEQELAKFHTPEYVHFLKGILPETARSNATAQSKFAVGDYTDCPIFDGLFQFCQTYTGASLDGAVKLNHGLADICINWSGGLHHAKKSEASGFCYVNDIVLAILELLKHHARVLYVDIDIHHGDGVEEAFYASDRVMTLSFHKYGDFFPGTGNITDVGSKAGKYYSVNFPLSEGVDDASFQGVFKPVLDKVMEVFRPSAVVLQCGADSLTGDRLGCFNLTLHGHAECVRLVKSYNVPTLVLGGGGYTIRNVARCWAYETAVLCGEDVSDDIPYNDYYEYYSPDFKLHLTPFPNMDNSNSPDTLEKYKRMILTQLQSLQGAPSVQFQEIAPDYITPQRMDDAAAAVEEADPDQRLPRITKDGAKKRRSNQTEHYDGKGKGRARGGSGTAAAASTIIEGMVDRPPAAVPSPPPTPAPAPAPASAPAPAPAPAVATALAVTLAPAATPVTALNGARGSTGDGAGSSVDLNGEVDERVGNNGSMDKEDEGNNSRGEASADEWGGAGYTATVLERSSIDGVAGSSTSRTSSKQGGREGSAQRGEDGEASGAGGRFSSEREEGGVAGGIGERSEGMDRGVGAGRAEGSNMSSMVEGNAMDEG